MRAKILTGLLSAGLLLLVTVHPTAQSPASTERKLILSFDRNGLVTLVAQNVTVREILAEWTRQGGTQIGREGGAAGRRQTDRRADHRAVRRSA